jgi:hypothetical protein
MRIRRVTSLAAKLIFPRVTSGRRRRGPRRIWCEHSRGLGRLARLFKHLLQCSHGDAQQPSNPNCGQLAPLCCCISRIAREVEKPSPCLGHAHCEGRFICHGHILLVLSSRRDIGTLTSHQRGHRSSARRDIGNLASHERDYRARYCRSPAWYSGLLARGHRSLRLSPAQARAGRAGQRVSKLTNEKKNIA